MEFRTGLGEKATFSLESEAEYLLKNPDVLAAVELGHFESGLTHYINFGMAEGRFYGPPKNVPHGSVPESLSHTVPYSRAIPLPENAFDLFPNQWSSAIPGVLSTGKVTLFNDIRVSWLITELSSIENWNVLELGPLEAGHTYMLETAGANVLAIEANFNAFLRCLIVKNYFDLKASFLLGDFAVSLGESNESYDLIVAAGVLYHMTNPIQLILDIARRTDRIFLWTHYFESNLQLWNPAIRESMELKWHLELETSVEINGVNVRTVPQSYGSALGWSGFRGGPEQQSNWIYKEDLLKFLKSLGFTSLKIAFDEPQHQNGPAFCILAERENH
jgi:hypothetical protein